MFGGGFFSSQKDRLSPESQSDSDKRRNIAFCIMQYSICIVLVTFVSLTSFKEFTAIFFKYFYGKELHSQLLLYAYLSSVQWELLTRTQTREKIIGQFRVNKKFIAF
jgi:hypothetical protein